MQKVNVKNLNTNNIDCKKYELMLIIIKGKSQLELNSSSANNMAQIESYN